MIYNLYGSFLIEHLQGIWDMWVLGGHIPYTPWESFVHSLWSLLHEQDQLVLSNSIRYRIYMFGGIILKKQEQIQKQLQTVWGSITFLLYWVPLKSSK